MTQVRYERPPQIIGQTATDKTIPLVELDDGTWTAPTQAVMAEFAAKCKEQFKELFAEIARLDGDHAALVQQVTALTRQLAAMSQDNARAVRIQADDEDKEFGQMLADLQREAKRQHRNQRRPMIAVQRDSQENRER